MTTTIVRAELKRLHSADLLDLEHTSPPDPTNFCLNVEAEFGPAEEKGMEIFGFLVCSPKWLTTEVEREGYVLGRHYIFMPRYDYRCMLQILDDIAEREAGPDWETVATRLARYGQWEFEDYNRYAPQPQEV